MNSTLAVSPPTMPTLPCRLSFRPFVAYLKRQQANAQAEGTQGLYRYMIDQFDWISPDESWPDVVDQQRLAGLFELASVIVLPLTGSSPQLPFAFGLPTPLTLFQHSPAFAQLLDQYPDLVAKLRGQISAEHRLRFMYQLILDRCYGVKGVKNTSFSFHFQNEINGLNRHFQINSNNAFIAPRLMGDLPVLQPAWIDFVDGSGPLPTDLPQLPIADFSFEGFSFFTVEDVTEAEIRQRLQNIVDHLRPDTAAVSYQQFEHELRNLVGQPDLAVRIIPLPQVNGSFVLYPDERKRSIFLDRTGISLHSGRKSVMQQRDQKISQHRTPYLLPAMDGLPEPDQQVFYQKGVHSFLMYPIATASEMLGILEMSSPHPNAIQEPVLNAVERVMTLLQGLLRHQLRQFDERLENMVKINFTPLQPAVEWKFYEAAWADLRAGQTEGNRQGTTVVRFPQVSPFYGAVDVRDSSLERQKASRQDLTDQFGAVDELLNDLTLLTNLVHPEQLTRQFKQWQTKLTDGLQPDDELGIALFLSQELNPYFRQLMPGQSSSQGVLQRYFAQIDPQTGQFQQTLKRYDRSMDWLNAVINEYIVEEENQLQAVYPHYVDRYRTDGMEYTLYVGQSMASDIPFTPDIRRRLADWQLNSMVEMAQLTHRLLPRLPLPLQTTQLILAHSQPVDISFRPDERRFDVEGSYSIRYEVLKKRIDKAFIRSTQERLTQPDTIALVYTQPTELEDYLSAIANLQERGQLQTNVDYLTLAPMQGVDNLKALRLWINYAD